MAWQPSAAHQHGHHRVNDDDLADVDAVSHRRCKQLKSAVAPGVVYVFDIRKNI